MTAPAPNGPPPRGKAYLVGLLSYSALIVAGTATLALQVISQAWYPEAHPTDGSCRQATHRLLPDLQQARQSAALAMDEGSMLKRFRKTLGKDWANFAGVTELCKQDLAASATLRVLRQLRYAEEHGLRYETRELSRLRSRARQLVTELK